MAEYIIPSTVKTVLEYLGAFLDVPVYHSVPRERPGAYVRVSRSGGPIINPATDKPIVTIQCYHSDAYEAEMLANRCRGLMMGVRGKKVGDVWVRWWDEAGGPVENPDPDVSLTRYQFSGDLFIKIN